MPLSKTLQAVEAAIVAQNNREHDRVFNTPIPASRWCCRYRYKADHPWCTTTHRSDSPRELVQFMRDHFNGNTGVLVEKLWIEG